MTPGLRQAGEATDNALRGIEEGFNVFAKLTVLYMFDCLISPS